MRNIGDNVSLPPGPKMPRALQALGWSRRPLAFMQRAQENYGDVFTLRIGHAGAWVLLCNPAHAKELFTTDPRELGVGVANGLLGPLLGSRSVMLLEEPEHMTRRKLMLPSFHGASASGYSELIDDVTRREIATWPRGEAFELWPRMQNITLEVIMRVVFGDVQTPRLTRLRELLEALTSSMNNGRRLALLALIGPGWIARDPRFRRTMVAVEATIAEEIRERQHAGANGASDDVLSMLLQVRYEDGSALSWRDLRDELVTLLSDGPTATLLAWAFERLLRHPDKLARLRAEVDDGAEQVYLDAVVKEITRLCPSVPVVLRRLAQPMLIAGHTLPAGTAVGPCIHLIHRSSDVYERPRSFMPERFLGDSAGAYSWIPFGGGARRCIAASYAQLEMRRVIHTVLGEVELRAAEQRSARAERSAIAFSPGARGHVVVERRRRPSGRRAWRQLSSAT
jgi:cytochrome P450 family 135